MPHYMSGAWDGPCGRVASVKKATPGIPIHIHHYFSDTETNVAGFNFVSTANLGYIVNNVETSIAKYTVPREGLIRVVYEGVDSESASTTGWTDVTKSVSINVRCTSPSGKTITSSIVTIPSDGLGSGSATFSANTLRRGVFTAHVKAGTVIEVYAPFPRIDGVDGSSPTIPPVYRPGVNVLFLLDW